MKTVEIPAAGQVQKKALVLLVDFPNEAGQTSREYFQDMMFGSQPAVAPKGSFKDYYLEVSYGSFVVSGVVNGGHSGWIRLPRDSTWYAADQGGFATYPQNAQKMAEDAVAAARTAGVDFGPYDTDCDGTVDYLFVVYAGQGYTFSGSLSDIWPHMWVTTSPVDTGSLNSAGQPVYVRPYTAEPEYYNAPGDMTIGVYAHEFGHSLGLPDLSPGHRGYAAGSPQNAKSG